MDKDETKLGAIKDIEWAWPKLSMWASTFQISCLGVTWELDKKQSNGALTGNKYPLKHS